MDRSDVITLYKNTISYDAYGVAQKTVTTRDVFCAVQSVTRSEFFDAGRAGLQPEFRMTMFSGDYDGETVIGYKGRLYSVYRTYHAKTDIIELYVERTGAYGTESSDGADGGDDGEDTP